MPLPEKSFKNAVSSRNSNKNQHKHQCIAYKTLRYLSRHLTLLEVPPAWNAYSESLVRKWTVSRKDLTCQTTSPASLLNTRKTVILTWKGCKAVQESFTKHHSKWKTLLLWQNTPTQDCYMKYLWGACIRKTTKFMNKFTLFWRQNFSVYRPGSPQKS